MREKEEVVAETNITVGHRSKSKHKCHVTEHVASPSDEMAGRKRPLARTTEHPLFSSYASSSSGGDTAPKKKAKHHVSVYTFVKWQRNFHREHGTLTWLKCQAR